MLDINEKSPTWFNQLMKKQDVSTEVLLRFKKHYFTSKQEELEK